MQKNEKTDIEIFEEIKKGNQESFQFLFDKYYNTLCGFCDYFVKSSSLSEELVADVFSTIWTKRNKINITINVKSYLYTSVKNQAFAHLKKKKLQIVPISDQHENSEQSNCTPEKRIIKEEKNQRIQHILEIIPPRSRKVFTLHKFENFKYKEIAILLDISIKTVENHMGKALKILRENYKSKSSLLIYFLNKFR